MAKDDLSGADIKAVCTEAGLLALRERRMRVTKADFTTAREKVSVSYSCQCMLCLKLRHRSYTARTRVHQKAYICDSSFVLYFIKWRRVIFCVVDKLWKVNNRIFPFFRKIYTHYSIYLFGGSVKMRRAHNASTTGSAGQNVTIFLSS